MSRICEIIGNDKVRIRLRKSTEQPESRDTANQHNENYVL